MWVSEGPNLVQTSGASRGMMLKLTAEARVDLNGEKV